MSATGLQRPAPDRDAHPDLRRDRFVLLYILVLAEPSPEFGGNWRTTSFGSALDDWQSFTRTLLNGLTAAGLLFIVASGFSLIFGLMRVVNMAHGSFYLLGGYIAYEVQQEMTGSGFTVISSDVNTWEWIFPALVAVGVIGAVGLVVQQVFLRWNQGQELRQALITIAISVILADQVIAHFNDGIAVSLTWPGWTDQLVALPPRDRLLGRAPLRPLPRRHGRGVPLGLAPPHPDRDGHPGGRRRPADDLGARGQHPAHLRDRVRRRLGRSPPSAASSAPRRAPSRRGRTASGSSTRSSS